MPDAAPLSDPTAPDLPGAPDRRDRPAVSRSRAPIEAAHRRAVFGRRTEDAPAMPRRRPVLPWVIAVLLVVLVASQVARWRQMVKVARTAPAAVRGDTATPPPAG